MARIPYRRRARRTAQHRLGPGVVGVGASAGGLEAFSALLESLPADTGMSFVFISHLDPEHESILTSLLSRTTPMPVLEAKHGMALEPDHVYVIPRNARMTVNGRVLSLSRRLQAPAENLPIDHFMKSLARDRKQKAIGVILSGTASDGTMGLMAIKSENGLTVVQDPGTARYDGMPRSAIRAKVADFVLPPKEIAALLARIARRPGSIAPASPGDAEQMEGSLTAIFDLLRERTGADFSTYKEATVQRRLRHRMVLRKLRSQADYARLLAREPAEVDALYEDLLIKVTGFFRDPAAFEKLGASILPSMFKGKPPKEPFRVWVPGCSTGEEAYSIAMLLLEIAAHLRVHNPIQVFATDLSETAIAAARKGRFPTGITGSMSRARLRRFFIKLGPEYQIVQRVRAACVFARQDVARDPPFSKVDLVSCRNVLIYMRKSLQDTILPIFHYALKPGGCLFLGKAETLESVSGLFTMVDSKHRIYRKKSGAAIAVTGLPSRRAQPATRVAGRRAGGVEPPLRAGAGVRDEANRLVLERLASAGVVRQNAEEELKSANEELMSSMEELQSANEELQTSHEELESTNEELTTVNDQLAIRNRDLTEISDDLTNLVASVDVPILILTGGLRLRRSTVAADKVLGLTPADIGRHVSDIRHSLKLPNLEAEVAEVLKTLGSREIEVQDRSNVWYSMRLQPYRTGDGRIDGLVVVLFEIDRLKRSFQEVEHARNFSRTIVETVQEPLLVLGGDRRVLMANQAFLKTFRASRAEMEERLVFELEPAGFRSAAFRTMLEETWSGHLPRRGFEIEFKIGAAAPTIMAIDARRFDLHEDRGRIVLLTMRDITRFRHTEQRLLAAHKTVQKGRLRAESSLRESKRALSASAVELRHLAGRLIRAQEDERKRVARELHDDLSQRLSALQLGSAGLARLTPKGASARADFEAHQAHLTEAVDEVRRLAYDLHPAILTHLGLRAALQSFCVEFSGREGIDVDFSAQKEPASLQEEVALCLYRVTQEALRNVARHSGAKSASVSLKASRGALRLVIQDSGRGFEAHPNRPGEGLGLLSMNERVKLVQGALQVKSRPGRGTRIEARVPVSPRPRA